MPAYQVSPLQPQTCEPMEPWRLAEALRGTTPQTAWAAGLRFADGQLCASSYRCLCPKARNMHSARACVDGGHAAMWEGPGAHAVRLKAMCHSSDFKRCRWTKATSASCTHGNADPHAF